DIDHVQRDVKYKERPLLFRNLGGQKFEEIALKTGTALANPIVGRGLAYADIDLDGDLDVVITTNGGPAILLRNDGGNKNNAIRVTLQGTKGSRDGIGAIIEAKAGADTIRRTVHSGSSYCSASELPVTLGIGSNPSADITVTWPSGHKTDLKAVNANQM